jgi:endoglucanase
MRRVAISLLLSICSTYVGCVAAPSDDSNSDPGYLPAGAAGEKIPLPIAMPGPGPLRAVGNKLYDKIGNQILLRGINVYGFDTVDLAPSSFWAISWEQLFWQIKSVGFNTLRIPYSPDMFDEGRLPMNSSADQNQNQTNRNSFIGRNPQLAYVFDGTHKFPALTLFDAFVRRATEWGFLVVLDRHCNDADNRSEPNSRFWYIGDRATGEAQMVQQWQYLAWLFSANLRVIGADLMNEPQFASWGDGNIDTDWRLAAERIGNAVHAADGGKMLILVEGTGRGPGSFWGEWLGLARQAPVRLATAQRLMYSAHTYGNDVAGSLPRFAQKDPAQTAAFQADIGNAWNTQFGFIPQENITPIFIGELGALMNDWQDDVWLSTFLSYLNHPAVQGNFTYWSATVSNDTLGLLGINGDWSTPNPRIVNALKPYLYDPTQWQNYIDWISGI